MWYLSLRVIVSSAVAEFLICGVNLLHESGSDWEKNSLLCSVANAIIVHLVESTLAVYIMGCW